MSPSLNEENSLILKFGIKKIDIKLGINSKKRTLKLTLPTESDTNKTTSASENKAPRLYESNNAKPQIIDEM